MVHEDFLFRSICQIKLEQRVEDGVLNTEKTRSWVSVECKDSISFILIGLGTKRLFVTCY